MRIIVAAVVSCLLCTANAQELKLTGDVGVIEVERQVVVKDKLPLAKAIPFVIEAPAGGFGYSWDLPASVKANKKGAKLEITDAPRGLLTVSVTWTAIDFDKRTTEDKSATVTLVVVGITPPVPTDPLAKELHGLYVADPATDKAANIVKLAAVFRQAEKLVNQKNSETYTVTSAGQLADAVRAVSRLLLPVEALPAIRKRCGELIGESLADVDPDEPLSAEARTRAAALYGKIASALEQLK